MDALKLIPQSFFEFFARLVPGGVALAIWITLFDGARRWRAILETVAANRLDTHNVSVFAFFVGVSIAYGLGQLAAPFGKAAQRVSEFLAVPVAWILLRPRNWARDALGKKPIDLRDSQAWVRQRVLYVPAAPLSWILIAVRRWDNSPASKRDKNNYDYLRANAPELGALVAKIRSEHTMFNSLTAILAIAAIAYLAVQPARLWPTLALLLGAAIACACRGYFVEKTKEETAKKLRNAFDQFRILERGQGGSPTGHI